jgi:hypothetical protein
MMGSELDRSTADEPTGLPLSAGRLVFRGADGLTGGPGVFRFVSAACGLLIGCLLLPGCGAGSSAVSGKVTLDGQPLSGASVSFKSAATEPGRARGLFLGVTNEQGHYALRPASSADVGMRPGKYMVSITTTYVAGGVPDYQNPPIEKVPAKYRQGLEFDVPPTGPAEADFDLISKR